MLALLTSKLKAYALPLLLIAGVLVVVRGAQLRLERADARAVAAEARAAVAESAYLSAVNELKRLEHETLTRATQAEIVVQEVEKVRVETVEKLVYIESAPVPSTCPGAIEFLVNFGEGF